MAETIKPLDSQQDGGEGFTSRLRSDFRLTREKSNGSSPGPELVAGLVEEQTKRLRALCDGYGSYLYRRLYEPLWLTIVIAVAAVTTFLVFHGLPPHETVTLGQPTTLLLLMEIGVVGMAFIILQMSQATSRRIDLRTEIETSSKLLTRLVRKLSQIEEHTEVDMYTAIEFDFLLADAEAAISRAERIAAIPLEKSLERGD